MGARRLWTVAMLAVVLCAPALAGLQAQQTVADQMASSTDVPWLEAAAGSLAGAEKLTKGWPEGYHVEERLIDQEVQYSNLPHTLIKRYRTAAYARLGELATPEALAAIHRMEQAAKAEVSCPATVDPTHWMYPAWHTYDRPMQEIARAPAPDGGTYVVLNSGAMGDCRDLFLTELGPKDPPERWKRPKLLAQHPEPNIRDARLSSNKDGILVLSYVQEAPGAGYQAFRQPAAPPAVDLGPHTLEFRLEDVYRDSDGDGWTDIEEQRMGLDPKNADSDGDRTPDGADICPDYNGKKAVETDETRILQKTFFATFGLSGSHYLIFVRPKSTPVELWGYPGPVVYAADWDKWHEERPATVIGLAWSVKLSGESATVSITDLEGPLQGSDVRVDLRKFGDDWYVQKVTPEGIF